MIPLSGAVVTAAEMRAAEEAAMDGGTTVSVLMERAGAAVAEAVWRFGGGAPVLFCCGPGNNGGDGYVAARILRHRGLDVRVSALAEPRTDAAIQARRRWDGEVDALITADPAPVLVDAMFGTGLSKPLAPPHRAALSSLSSASRLVVAVDVPSGVDSDSGADLGAIACDITVALGALKRAHLLDPASALCGRVIRGEIGIAVGSPVTVLERPAVPGPSSRDHKYSRGLVAVVAGEMDGAAMLAARAAQRSGAGYVVLAGHNATGPAALVTRSVEAILCDDRLSAVVIGCGLGRGERAGMLVDAAVAAGRPLVIDADALALLDPDRIACIESPAIVTPHEGEFLSLFGDLPGSRVDRALAAARACGKVVILKGALTVIASPDGRARLASRAPASLASAGTGDVLAGIAGTMLAQLHDPFEAAGAAVWLHAAAARIAGPCLIADDLPAALPLAVARCA